MNNFTPNQISLASRIIALEAKQRYHGDTGGYIQARIDKTQRDLLIACEYDQTKALQAVNLIHMAMVEYGPLWGSLQVVRAEETPLGARLPREFRDGLSDEFIAAHAEYR